MRPRQAMPLLHPATLLIAWFAGILALQCLASPTGGSALILICAAIFSTTELLSLLRRSRWLLLSLLVLFVWATPGILLPGWPGRMGITQDGVAAAADHMLRLLAVLGLVALLLGRLELEAVVSGLHALMAPLRMFGVDRGRIALRLMLTLQYAATSRARVSPLQFGNETELPPPSPLTLPARGWGWADGCVLTALALLGGGAVFA